MVDFLLVFLASGSFLGCSFDGLEGSCFLGSGFFLTSLGASFLVVSSFFTEALAEGFSGLSASVFFEPPFFLFCSGSAGFSAFFAGFSAFSFLVGSDGSEDFGLSSFTFFLALAFSAGFLAGSLVLAGFSSCFFWGSSFLGSSDFVGFAFLGFATSSFWG